MSIENILVNARWAAAKDAGELAREMLRKAIADYDLAEKTQHIRALDWWKPKPSPQMTGVQQSYEQESAHINQYHYTSAHIAAWLF